MNGNLDKKNRDILLEIYNGKGLMEKVTLLGIRSRSRKGKYFLKFPFYFILLFSSFITISISTPPEDQGTWKKFSSQAAGFSVLFPGKPIEKKQTAETGIVGRIEFHSFVLKTRDLMFGVVRGNYLDRDLSQLDPIEALESGYEMAVTGVLKQGGRVIYRKSISLNGYPGLEVKVESPQEGITGILRDYVVDERSYQILVFSNPGQEFKDFSKTINKFLNSFSLLN